MKGKKEAKESTVFGLTLQSFRQFRTSQEPPDLPRFEALVRKVLSEFSRSDKKQVFFFEDLRESLVTVAVQVVREFKELDWAYDKNYIDRANQLVVFKLDQLFLAQITKYQLPKKYFDLKVELYNKMRDRYSLIEQKNRNFFDEKKHLELTEQLRLRVAEEGVLQATMKALLQEIVHHFCGHKLKQVLLLESIPTYFKDTVNELLKDNDLYSVSETVISKTLCKLEVIKLNNPYYFSKRIDREALPPRSELCEEEPTIISHKWPSIIESIEVVAVRDSLMEIKVSVPKIQMGVPVLAYEVKITQNHWVDIQEFQAVQSPFWQTLVVRLGEQIQRGKLSQIELNVRAINLHGKNPESKCFKVRLPLPRCQLFTAGQPHLLPSLYERASDKFHRLALNIPGCSSLAVSQDQDFFLLADSFGSTITWGNIFLNNSESQLGGPYQFGKSGVVKVCCGQKAVCLLDFQGRLWAAGSNQSGQLGLDSNKVEYEHHPTEVKFQNKYVRVMDFDLQYSHCVAVSDKGKLYSWGANQTIESAIPVMSKNYGIVNFAPPPLLTLCSLKPRCLSDSLSDQFVAVKAGHLFSLAVNSQGQVYSWGTNEQGQLGQKLYNQREVEIKHILLPHKLKFFGQVIEIAVGHSHVLAVTACHELFTWGGNKYSQTGHDGSKQKTITEPRRLENEVKRVFAGGNASCFIDCQNSLFVMGHNFCGKLCAEEQIVYPRRRIFEHLPLCIERSRIADVVLGRGTMSILVAGRRQ